MAIDQSLVGREFPAVGPREVTADDVRAFARSVGLPDDGPVPPTYPIVLAFDAMLAFLDAEQLELRRIVHGEQRFAYARPVEVGDRLTAALAVRSLRQIGGNDIIGTTSTMTDAAGALVCTTTATLVHRGAS